MDLSVIIVSWNVKERLEENLEALLRSEKINSFEVFVVDNNSADGSAEMVRDKFPGVKLIANKENLGFAKANNQAIIKASGKYMLLLNPDMRLKPDTLYNMVSWMEANKRAGIAGCRLVDPEGRIVPHARRFPTLWDQLSIILKLPHIIPGVLNNYLMKGFDYGKNAPVDSIRGSFFMVRRKVIDKIGPLDERFFIWFEEVDYCRRAKQAGWEVWYTGAAECADYVGQSFKLLKKGQTQKYFRDSMVKYFKKWHPLWQAKIIELAWPIGQLAASIGEKLNFKSRTRT